MYDELVALLRKKYDKAPMVMEAADAIEELDKLLDGVSADNDSLCEKIERMVKAEKPYWVSVTEQLPEECEGLDWHEDLMIRFTSVWCCDAKTGTLEVRNRLQGKKTGNEFLDQYTKDTDYHWSKSQTVTVRMDDGKTVVFKR